MAHRITDPRLAAIELVPALTTVRQMRDMLVHALGRDQLAGFALMPGLTAGLTHRALVRLPRQSPTLRPRLRWIRRRRHRTVTRVAIALALELIDPLLKATDHRPHRIDPLRVKRVRVLSQHERKIPCITQEPCSQPRHPLNAYLWGDR